MPYYPIFLDIKNRPALVVGGGAVAFRKVLTLLECSARVTVVAPAVNAELRELAAGSRIRVEKRAYQSADMDGMFLIIAATDNDLLNLQIRADADKAGRLCNIADRPEACDFILPAVVKRGDLIIAISTSGKSPAFAKRLRREFEAMFGPEYAAFLRLMGAVRRKLLAGKHEPEAHKILFESMIDSGLVRMLKEGDRKGIDALLYDTFGSGYEYDELMDAQSEGVQIRMRPKTAGKVKC